MNAVYHASVVVNIYREYEYQCIYLKTIRSTGNKHNTSKDERVIAAQIFFSKVPKLRQHLN